MSAPKLRLIHGSDAVADSNEVQLANVEEVIPLIRRLLDERFNGEVVLRGEATARFYLYDGKVAWIRVEHYPEHLGAVMRRELGVSQKSLRQAIAHCQQTGQRFGEGMVGLGLVSPSELRNCLFRHISDQLWELLTWSGPLVAELGDGRYRYDDAFTFDFDELLARPTRPSMVAMARIKALVSECRRRLPELTIACVIEDEEGTLLYPNDEDSIAALDLLGLCTAGLRRLVANRITRGDGQLECVVLDAADSRLVVQPIPWHAGGLLILAGPQQLGRLISIAAKTTQDPPQ